MKPFLESRYFARRAIRTDHDLLLLFVQGVERMEKLFLGTLFPRHELDIVDKQHIYRSVLLTKELSLVIANSINQLIHELLRRDVAEIQMLVSFLYLVAAGMHEMRFPEPHTT